MASCTVASGEAELARVALEAARVHVKAGD